MARKRHSSALYMCIESSRWQGSGPLNYYTTFAVVRCVCNHRGRWLNSVKGNGAVDHMAHQTPSIEISDSKFSLAVAFFFFFFFFFFFSFLINKFSLLPGQWEWKVPLCLRFIRSRPSFSSLSNDAIQLPFINSNCWRFSFILRERNEWKKSCPISSEYSVVGNREKSFSQIGTCNWCFNQMKFRLERSPKMDLEIRKTGPKKKWINNRNWPFKKCVKPLWYEPGDENC